MRSFDIVPNITVYSNLLTCGEEWSGGYYSFKITQIKQSIIIPALTKTSDRSAPVDRVLRSTEPKKGPLFDKL